MRVAVHAKVLSDEQLTGIGYYAYHLLKELVNLDRRNEYVLFSNSPIYHPIFGVNCSERIITSPSCFNYFMFPSELEKNSFDLMFVPKQTVPLFSKPPAVITVHDLAGLRYASEISHKEWLHYYLTPHYFAKRAEAVLADSESTRQELIYYSGISPDRVFTVPLGHDPLLFRAVHSSEVVRVKKKYGIQGDYFVNTSSFLGYRKNLTGLIRAFHMSTIRKKINHQLVITGDKGPCSDEVKTLIHALGLQNKVLLLGYVARAEMPVLLSGAEALVFPSLSEGFGLPVVEAFACGCPVITSDCSSLPEVAGEAGLLVSPLQREAIAQAMEKIAQSPALRNNLRRKGLRRAKLFTWVETAKKTLEVFRQVARVI